MRRALGVAILLALTGCGESHDAPPAPGSAQWRARGPSPTPDISQLRFKVTFGRPTIPENIKLGLLLKGGLRDVIGLSYTDRDGVTTERVVTVLEAHGKIGGRLGWQWVNYLVAYCHLRSERRIFSVRHIEEITTRNGNVIHRDIEPWLAGRYGVRPFAGDPDPPQLTLVAPKILVVYGRTDRPSTYEVEGLSFDGFLAGHARRFNKGGSLGVERDMRFYADGIRSVAYADTGEVIPDLSEWVATLSTQRRAPAAGSFAELVSKTIPAAT